MEVGRDYALPLHAIATSNPVGCLKPTDKHQVVCTPAKYTCTKCQSQYEDSAELHRHLVICGKSGYLLYPTGRRCSSEFLLIGNSLDLKYRLSFHFKTSFHDSIYIIETQKSIFTNIYFCESNHSLPGHKVEYCVYFHPVGYVRAVTHNNQR